jgi:hypothetical protein
MTEATFPSLTLDHVGAITRDLAAGAERWERLGFTLSPLSRQRGGVPGKQGMHPWASANRCAIFRKGYLELIGIVDASAHNPWRHFLERFEGLHVAALRCGDAEQAYARLHAEATFLDPPIARERKLTYRGAEHTMRFRNIFSRDAECPEGRYIVIEHQTPELLWQEELLAHENGALGLEEVFIVSDDPAVAGRVRALGCAPKLLGTKVFAERFGFFAPAPSFAAITVSFSNLENARDLMQGRGIVPRRDGDAYWLDPEHTNGFVMRLIEQVSTQVID